MAASTQTKTLTNDHSNPLRLVGEKLAAEPEYKYARFLPSVAPPSGVLPPLEEFTHVDPAHRAKKLANPRAIFEAPGVQVSHIIPATGSEVRGVKLHELDASGRDQVALEVAKRGVVAFRDQEFGEQSFDWLKEWGSVRLSSALSTVSFADSTPSPFCSTLADCTSTRRLRIPREVSRPDQLSQRRLRADGSPPLCFQLPRLVLRCPPTD